YIRGKVEDYRLGKEINLFELDEDDRDKLNLYLKEYCQDFNLNLKEILKDKFIKLIPYTHRPYGSLYAY
ncbi:MAG: hypothetical protein ACE5HR_02370, partial [bacterium]